MDHLHELVVMIRRRLVLRRVALDTVSAAMACGAIAIVLSIVWPWAPRWAPWVLVSLGPIVGWIRARRSMPSEEALVMFVDRRLGADEAIVTAWELGEEAPPFCARTVRAARDALEKADADAVRPKIRIKQAAWLPLALGFFAGAFFVPTPSRGMRDAGSEQVRVQDAEALRRVERLALQERNPERRRELAEIAREARELRRALAHGMERREAEERLEEVRRRLRTTRRQATDEERRARDAALEALAREPEMRRALEERDLDSLDRAVERAAARREAADRQRARDALREAAAAARREGDEPLAQSLLERERLLERRQEQAALARELAEALPELEGARVSRQLERLSRDGDGSGLTREMVSAMRDAWSRLTPEERQRLADAMRRAQAAENTDAQARSDAAQQPISADEMERRLREALENLDRLQAQVGSGGQIPMPGSGSGSGSGSGNGSGSGSGSGSGNGNGNGNGSGGSGGGGPGNAGGRTDPVGAGDGPLARVRPTMGTGAPSRTTFEWTNPEGMPLPEGMPEAGASGEATSGEAGAIERAPIPEDYRDHVRTYFGGGDE